MLCALMYLLHMPVVDTFMKYNYFSHNENAPGYIKESIANMGYSETHCQRESMVANGSIALHCATGYIDKLFSWGVHTNVED